MLNTQPNLQDPDGFYEALTQAHHGLATADSHALNARLVLLLANHIGHAAVLRHALQLARGPRLPDEASPAAIQPVTPTHTAAVH